MPMKNSSTSGAIGAAPDEAWRQRRRPMRSCSGRNTSGYHIA